jgi:hypothetical protein
VQWVSLLFLAVGPPPRTALCHLPQL